MRELLFRVLFLVYTRGFQADHLAPGVHLLEPLFKGLLPGVFADEVLDLHLLKFNDAEDKVARSDLVAESFSDLGDAKGDADSHGVDDVLVVEEDRLGCFGSQVGDVSITTCFAHVSGEHEVEVAGLGKVLRAALGAFDFMLMDQLVHLGDRKAICILVERLFDEVIAAEAPFAGFAIDQGIVEALEVAGGGPRLGVEEDGAIEPNHVASLLDKGLPPEVFDVFFQLGAVGAKRVSVGKSTVNLRARVDKTPSLTKSYDRFKAVLDVLDMVHAKPLF